MKTLSDWAALSGVSGCELPNRVVSVSMEIDDVA